MKFIRNIGFMTLMLFSIKVEAQELQAKITINASRVSSVVDKKVFQTLQGALNNLLNNHKWSSETFQQNEKIVCNFMLNIAEGSDNVYSASMIIQAARPIFNTSYESPLINWQDENVVFKYIEYQPVVFNENRVSGSDGLANNLTAILAYYVYVILGLDFDSFALKGGDPYFQKAQNIVNNAPEGRDVSGWRAFDGLRNRYWLMENLTNNRYSVFHEAFYNYYRKGFDVLYENESEARTSILGSLTQLNTMNNDIPNSMIVPFFFQGKSSEIIRVFKKAPPEEKQKAREMLSRMDVSNSNNYKQELK
jgi:hypothetical protein